MSGSLQVAGEPTPARLVLTLSLAGLLSGLIIVAVFEATLPTIVAYQAQQLRAAVLEVLPGTGRLQRLAWREGALVADDAGPADEQAVYAGYAPDGGFVGYAIPGAGPGFQDTIRLLYGYLPGERRIVGMRVLDSRETPGLGDKIYKDADFLAEFRDLAIDPEVMAVKKGSKTGPHQVDAITGATISSKAVVRIINEANRLWLGRLEGYRPPPATAPPAPQAEVPHHAD